MNDFQKEAVITALKHMFKGTHFSICDIDKCLKITKTIPNQIDYEALSALHCIHWSEMSPELRKLVLDKTIKMLSSDSFDLSIIDMAFDKKSEVFKIKEKKKFFKILG